MKRLIARLDVKSNFLIKGVRFEGLRKIGDPAIAAQKYYIEGIDEIFLVDNVASLFGRNHLGTLLERVARDVLVPLTVAGGIRTIRDAENLFGLGADKLAVNTASFSNPNLISEIANKFGSQAIVGSIQAQRLAGGWECLVEQGRDRTGVPLVDRIHQLVEFGAGELLVTSVDNDGVMGGYDLQLAEVAAASSSVPVVIGGGCGGIDDALRVMKIEKLSGLAMGSALHFGHIDISELKTKSLEQENLLNEGNRG